MKKGLLILGWVLFLLTASYSYVSIGRDVEPVKEGVSNFNYNQGIDPEFKPYLNKFILEGKKRGHDYTSIIENNIKVMAYTPLVEYPTLGLAIHNRDAILIADFVEVDWVMARFIIYHEVGHMVVGSGKGHTCDSCLEIMTANTPPTFSPYVGEYWDRKLDNLFNWIELKRSEELRPEEVECL